MDFDFFPLILDINQVTLLVSGRFSNNETKERFTSRVFALFFVASAAVVELNQCMMIFFNICDTFLVFLIFMLCFGAESLFVASLFFVQPQIRLF